MGRVARATDLRFLDLNLNLQPVNQGVSIDASLICKNIFEI